MWLSLTFDHRVADGADAARLLDHIASSIAHPEKLIQKAPSTFAV